LLAALRSSTFVKAFALAGACLAFFALAYVFVELISGGNWRDLCDWDCKWYQSIAERGYDVDPRARPYDLQANYAFYPAFPLAVSAIMAVTPLSFSQAGMLLSGLFSGLFCWLVLVFYRELRLPDERAAIVFLLAFLLSPFSLANHIPYTEMLFNLAALATFVAWRREQYVAAALCGFVLTATRLTGVVLPIALLLELLIRERWRIGPMLLRPDARMRALAVMPLGLASFMVYLGLHVGDPLANVRVQEFGWDHGFNNPLLSLATAFFANSALAAAGAGTIIGVTTLLVLGIRAGRIPIPLAALAFFSYAIPATSRMMSVPRYALAIFPVYLVAAMLPKPLQRVLIPLLALLQIVAVHLWLTHHLVLV